MKAHFAIALVVATVGLMGCATTPAPLTKADVDGRVVCNYDRMDDLDRKARMQGHQVVWVNCPRATLRAM